MQVDKLVNIQMYTYIGRQMHIYTWIIDADGWMTYIDRLYRDMK